MCVKFSMQTSIPCRGGGGIHCMEENVLPKESHGIGIAKKQSQQSHLSSSPFSTSSTLYAYPVVTHIEVIVSAQTSVSVGLASSGTLYI